MNTTESYHRSTRDNPYGSNTGMPNVNTNANANANVNANVNVNMNVPNNINMSMMHPRMFDSKIKTHYVNQNIFHSGFGDYKVCPPSGSLRFPYKSNYDPGTIGTICKVLVHNKHAIDVANVLCEHGLNSLTLRKPFPVIMYPMGNEFLGTNLESREGIYDENIILRSNYPYAIKRQNDLFDKKESQKYVVYSNPITIIRDHNYAPLNYDNIFKVGVITVCYEKKNDLLVEKKTLKEGERKDAFDDIKTLSSTDLLNLLGYIENVFQAAICGNHDVLLLTLFSKEFKIPIDEQIMVYNICIMKYGHMLKGIMICIPPYEGKDLFEYFDKHIIKPQFLTKDIDMKYQAEAMAKRMKQSNTNIVDQNVNGNNNNNKNNKSNKNNKTNVIIKGKAKGVIADLADTNDKKLKISKKRSKDDKHQSNEKSKSGKSK
jgi:hypothetical protein